MSFIKKINKTNIITFFRNSLASQFWTLQHYNISRNHIKSSLPLISRSVLLIHDQFIIPENYLRQIRSRVWLFKGNCMWRSAESLAVTELLKYPHFSVNCYLACSNIFSGSVFISIFDFLQICQDVFEEVLRDMQCPGNPISLILFLFLPFP